MSGEEAPVVAAVAETLAPLGETMDLMTALQLVLKKSLAHGGLCCGFHEGAIRSLKSMLLNFACWQRTAISLIMSSLSRHSVLSTMSACLLSQVPKPLASGLVMSEMEIAWHCCSCAVIRDFGEESEGLHVV